MIQATTNIPLHQEFYLPSKHNVGQIMFIVFICLSNVVNILNATQTQEHIMQKLDTRIHQMVLSFHDYTVFTVSSISIYLVRGSPSTHNCIGSVVKLLYSSGLFHLCTRL